jgi:hypothetical protein
MTGDTLPPDEAANDTEPPPPLVIPAGQAQAAFSAALDDLVRAFVLVEATGMALARLVDSQVGQEAP